METDERSTQRPPIPAALRRQVLVEAGHRCAIPTCRRSPIEIAHIVPWTQVRAHDFANLIVLCPNDHTRYDAGEIDRQAMFQYKANLAELTGRYGYFEIRVLHYFAAHNEVEHFPCAGGLTLLFQGLIDDGLLEKQASGHGDGTTSAGILLENRDDETGEVLTSETLPFAELYLLTQRGRALVTSWSRAEPIDG